MSKPKVIISTDLGGGDKDDAQSLIHALLYADQLDYQGIVMTGTDDSQTNPRPDFDRILAAYEDDLANLRKHGDFPSADEINSLFKQGTMNPAWPGGLSEGVQHIIKEARAASPSDPLYLLGWGAVHDIARALHEAPDIVPNVRVYQVMGYGQDPAHPQAWNWLTNAIRNDPQYRDLWMINSEEGIRGMFMPESGKNATDWNLPWVKENIDGHGALGDLFHDKYSYDIFDYADGANSRTGLKMGDTPSLLYLVDNVNDDNPGAASWGGSFQKSGLGPNTWEDKDGSADRMGSYDGARTVYEHRSEAWGDFADRLDMLLGGTSAPEPTPQPDPEPSPDPSSPIGSAAIGVGLTEIETLTLQGYEYENRDASSGGANVKVFGSGSATGTFAGSAGSYEVTVGYFNEDDGNADWSLLVNGTEAMSWSGSGGSNAEETLSVDVRLEQGDVITLEGHSDNGEFARLDWMTVAAEEEGLEAEPDLPANATRIAAGLTEAETLDLSGYEYERRDASSGGANVKVDGSGTASGIFDGETGLYMLTVGYFNEDDGNADWSLLVEGEDVANWGGRGGSNDEETVSVQLALEKGDSIRLEGHSDNGEFARLDWLQIDPIDTLSDTLLL